MAIKKKIKYPAISLFSGAFGLDLGLEKAGFEIRACVEKSNQCCATILKNRPEMAALILNQDINSVSARLLLKKAKLKRGEAFLVSGGPPCQPFSTVGRRKSISSNEGLLFEKFLEIVWGIYPKFFIFENVKGILSAAIQHKPLELRNKPGAKISEKQKLGSGWDFINDQFKTKLKAGKKAGYSLHVWELNASDFGVPQRRKRVFIVGVRGLGKLDQPEGKFKIRPVSLRRAIGHLNGNHEMPGKDYLEYDKVRYKIFSKNLVKQGQNWTALPKHLQKKVMGQGFYATGGKVGFCRRLSWDKPCPTITTNPMGRATNLCHPEKPRPLNYRECALIQGFPESWEFVGSVSQKYKQIGNAVPIKLATAIGKKIIKTWEENINDHKI
jgi:DNA (cytosine-5)-methyltransferase 1